MNRRARRAAAAQSSNRITFQPIITPPKIRRGLLLGASGLTLAIALGVANEAAASDECGVAAGVPPSVTCKASGNPYPNGIRYEVEDLTIVVKSGVIVDTTTAVGEVGGIASGGTTASPFSPGSQTVTVNSGVSIKTDGSYAPGISVITDGDVTVNTKAVTISTVGTKSAGIWAESEIEDVKVTASGTISTVGYRAWGITAFTFADNVTSAVDSSANITTTGAYADGIVADTGSGANADITVTSSGKITTSGAQADGLYGYTSFGAGSDVTITNLGTISVAGHEADGIRAITRADNGQVTATSNGKISTAGYHGFGIYAASSGDNSDVLVVSTGTISTTGGGGDGILATTEGDGSDVTITSTGKISTTNGEAHGIAASTQALGTKISIVSTGPITIGGGEADGIHTETHDLDATASIISTGAIITTGFIHSDAIDGYAVGDVTITSTGKISTTGRESIGINALSELDITTVNSSGAITTIGRDSDGIHAVASNGNVVVNSSGAIKAGGYGAYGIWATSGEGSVVVNSTGPVTTAGTNGDAIWARSGAALTINAKNASASGEDADGIDARQISSGAIAVSITGAVSGGWDDARGVRVTATNAPTVFVAGGASLGALSDFALQEGDENLSLINKGTITGFLDTGGGNDTLSNAAGAVWELRDFADTNGDGKRDLESVAFASFGSGTDSFDNQGTLTLGKAAGAVTFDTTGAIIDPHGTDGDLTLNNVEQGQITGLEQFTNSGIITMQDGKTGDFLAITDAGSAGPGGSGIFTSNGGSLHLDVRLDDGSSGKADMLFLDIAKSGAGGATQVFITKAGGAGALTKGDGIEVIDVDVSSTSDAFTLGTPVVAGAFEYDLEFQNLAATDQNWYLRSHPFAAAAAYPAIASSALTTWRADLGSLENRLSDLRLQMSAPSVTIPVTVAGIAEGGSMTVDPENFAGGWFNVTDSDDTVALGGVAGFSQETARSQMGFDFALNNVSGHDDWLVVGAFGGQGWSEADFDDADSSADFDIAAMGVYASYFRGPFHLDALVKFDWLDGNYNSDAVGGGGDVTLPVFGVSLNTGYQFDLTHSETGGLSLQPLAALDYAHVGGDTFHDNSGAEIELMEMDSLRGRLGARLVQQLLPAEDGTGPVGNFYLSAGVAQELLGESEARVTGVTLTQELPQTTFELGAGFDIALPADGVSFTFDTSAGFSEGEDNYGATGGVKFTW